MHMLYIMRDRMQVVQQAPCSFVHGYCRSFSPYDQPVVVFPVLDIRSERRRNPLRGVPVDTQNVTIHRCNPTNPDK